MKLTNFFIFLIIFVFSSKIFSQENNIEQQNNLWFVNIDYGILMSGIKSEDFVSSNYSPLKRISFGKWINSYYGFQLVYQGTYFYSISDNYKHFYNFYFFEGLLNVKKILGLNRKKDFYGLYLHGGLGLFKNSFYKKSSLKGNIGLTNNINISDKLKLKLDMSAIYGNDIYQGDFDILPSLSLGITYQL